MLSLELRNNKLMNNRLFARRCFSLFQDIQRTIYFKANREKYKVREKLVLSSDFIEWKKTPPDNLDLFYYITHCLVLHSKDDGYIIELDDYKTVRGSFTVIKDLVRLLEYGNEIIPAYPLIRGVLDTYSKIWGEDTLEIQERVLT